MGLLKVEELQSNYLKIEETGQGYSNYADLTDKEKAALTRVDAINIGVHAFELSTEEIGKLKGDEEKILQSPEWMSAAKKLAANPTVVEYIKRNK